MLKSLIALLCCLSMSGCGEGELEVSPGGEVLPPLTGPEYEVADTYTGFRELILDLKPDEIGFEGGATDVFALLMEIGYEEHAVTLASTSDGSASLYFSGGGAILGSGRQEAVSKVSKGLIEGSQKFLTHFTLVSDYPLPPAGQVHFYLVTPGGVYSARDDEQELGFERSSLSPLFYLGQDLITEIRKVNEG